MAAQLECFVQAATDRAYTMHRNLELRLTFSRLVASGAS